MLYGLFVLLSCQLLGEAVRHVSGWPVPGPVLGILLLVAYLAVSDRLKRPRVAARAKAVEDASDGLLAYLGVMFVPAGVGVVGKLDLLRENGPAIALVLLLSTAATLLVTVGTFRFVRRLQERRAP